MSADIIQFVPRPNPNRQEQERQAMELINIALMGESTMIGMEPVIHIEIPYGGQGIDGMGFDTAPSEMNPYTAPDKDSA
jgi:hypothetical protein